MVVERSTSPAGGYALGLYPLGSSVFHGLGTYDQLVERSLAVARYEVASGSGGVLKALDMAVLTGAVGPMLMISRPDLIGVLEASCAATDLRRGVTISSLEPRGDAVDVTFDDGTEERFDAVVGCDGMGSTTRELVFGPATIAAATHPVRAAILDAIRTPSTAAAVARGVGQTRQNVAYHVGELEKVGLLRHVGERRNGNFMEQTYVAVADTLVISPSCTWGASQPRTEALTDQLSLSELFAAGGQLQRDSAMLLDRAAFAGEEIPSASAITDIRFDSEESRAAFLHDYVEVLASLVHKHGSRQGAPYRLVLAAYPNPEEA